MTVISRLARGRQIVGGWRAVAATLGIGRRQAYARLALWRRAGLISESTGAANEYDDRGRRTFTPGAWTILPAQTSSERSERMREIARTRNRTRKDPASALDARARATGQDEPKAPSALGTALDACMPAVSVSTKNVREDIRRESQPLQARQAADTAQANAIIAGLENRHGVPITGRGRQLLAAALIENEAGVHACYDDACSRSQTPIGLLLHLLGAGEHLSRAEPAPRCEGCGQADASVHDRAPFLRAHGLSHITTPVLRCDRCTSRIALPDDLDQRR